MYFSARPLFRRSAFNSIDALNGFIFNLQDFALKPLSKRRGGRWIIFLACGREKARPQCEITNLIEKSYRKVTAFDLDSATINERYSGFNWAESQRTGECRH